MLSFAVVVVVAVVGWGTMLCLLQFERVNQLQFFRCLASLFLVVEVESMNV